MSSSPPPPLDPAYVAELEALAAEIGAHPDDRDLVARFAWLVKVLVKRGQIPAGFMKILENVRGEDISEDTRRVRLTIYNDKYQVENSDVDCVARYPQCKARCCRYEVPLSMQDLHEGKLPFQFDKPYLMPKDPVTGRCTFNDHGGCTVYEHRPGLCRDYDCRNDRRIWIDFEAGIAHPLPEGDPLRDET